MARILIVDDSPIILRMINFTLKKNGHTVFTAENGLAGLDILKNTAVDLIISDISMPEMDGITFIKKIRTQQKLTHLPVILLTANEGPSIRESAILSGVNQFLTKPASSNQIVNTVNALLCENQEVS